MLVGNATVTPVGVARGVSVITAPFASNDRPSTCCPPYIRLAQVFTTDGIREIRASSRTSVGSHGDRDSTRTGVVVAAAKNKTDRTSPNERRFVPNRYHGMEINAARYLLKNKKLKTNDNLDNLWQKPAYEFRVHRSPCSFSH